MRIVGHRGTPTTATRTENTLPAVAAALAAGADGVEVDVRTTCDGVVVLAHDPDLGRVLGTGTGTGPPVAATPWSVIRHLRLPCGAHVPALAEVLDQVAEWGAHVVVEVKAGTGPQRLRTAGQLAALLTSRRRRLPDADRVTTSSFDPLSARRLAGRGTVGSAVILRAHVDPRLVAPTARAHGLTELHLQFAHVARDPELVRDLHRNGLRVAAGTDDPADAHWLRRLGVDLVCTDDVAAVTSAVTAPEHRPPDQVAGSTAAAARAGDPRLLPPGGATSWKAPQLTA